jgi:ribosomal protein L12E/L44/L45/RPP1/RPP2
MRSRVAVATAAIAVLVIPAILFSLFTVTPAASTRVRHEAGTRHRSARIDNRLMSYTQAVEVARLATFYNAVNAQEVKTYLQEAAFLEAVASANTMPAAWQATATCEEGGRDDPYAGYFGILEWNGFDGYPTAGSAPLSVQLAWESAHGISPPDAPGQCHSY